MNETTFQTSYGKQYRSVSLCITSTRFYANNKPNFDGHNFHRNIFANGQRTKVSLTIAATYIVIEIVLIQFRPVLRFRRFQPPNATKIRSIFNGWYICSFLFCFLLLNLYHIISGKHIWFNVVSTTSRRRGSKHSCSNNQPSTRVYFAHRFL